MSEDEQLAMALAASVENRSDAGGSITSGTARGMMPSTAVSSAGVSIVSPVATTTTTAVDSIEARERPDPPKGAADTTSVQYRLPDGRRIVKKFQKGDRVRVLFEHLKAVDVEMHERPFEVAVNFSIFII